MMLFGHRSIGTGGNGRRQAMRGIGWALAIAIIVVSPSSGMADEVVGSGCDGQDVPDYCGSQFSEGFKNTFSTDRDDYVGRTNTVREAVGNCFDCALDRIDRGIEELEDKLRYDGD
jgi:hypothetical protein